MVATGAFLCARVRGFCADERGRGHSKRDGSGDDKRSGDPDFWLRGVSAVVLGGDGRSLVAAERKKPR